MAADGYGRIARGTPRRGERARDHHRCPNCSSGRGVKRVGAVADKYGDLGRRRRTASSAWRSGSFQNRPVAATRSSSSSAMGDTTDDLVSLASQVVGHDSPQRHGREMDMLLTAGERISMALLAMAICETGEQAVSLTGSQAAIITDDSHTSARIRDDPGRPRARGARSGADRHRRRGSRGSAQTPGRSQPPGEAGPIPARLPWRLPSGRSAATPTPTSTACSWQRPADRAVRAQARHPWSPTRRCSSPRRCAPRRPHLRRVEYGRAPATRSMLRWSFSRGLGPSSADRWRTFPWSRRSSPASRTTSQATITVVGVPRPPARRPRSSRWSRRRHQHRHDRGERARRGSGLTDVVVRRRRRPQGGQGTGRRRRLSAPGLADDPPPDPINSIGKPSLRGHAQPPGRPGHVLRRRWRRPASTSR